MPKIDIAKVPERKGSPYPAPFDAPSRRACGGGSATPAGSPFRRQSHAPSARQLVEPAALAIARGRVRLRARRRTDLIEEGGETVLRAGDCAAFPKDSGNGHHLINKSAEMAVYLEVGSRRPNDVTTCSDIDMMSSNADGRFAHKDGTPYPNS